MGAGGRGSGGDVGVLQALDVRHQRTERGLTLVAPATPAELIRNTRFALSLGLPELKPRAPEIRRMMIVASGPSALEAPLHLRGNTMALNNALDLFRGAGSSPTYWMCVDPGENVADFLTNAPLSTIYLVPSCAHPAVFKRLAGRKVALWHPLLEETASTVGPRMTVPVNVTVTLSSFHVGHLLGFRHFEVFGWDGCVIDGRDYTIPQGRNGDLTEAWMGPDGPRFITTQAWIVEAMKAKEQLMNATYSVRIRGPGMFGAILRRQCVGQVR